MLEVVLDAQVALGEGPVWDERRACLVFVDIMQGHVHTFDPRTRHHQIYKVGRPVGAVACTARGDWVLAAGKGFLRLDPDTGNVDAIVESVTSRPNVRMNDGNVDPYGRFWAGTASLVRESGQGTLYRLDADGRVHVMLEPVTTSNGIDWSPDGRRMYYTDTRTGRVDQFDFDSEAGTISHRRPFATINPRDGRPDGLIVDAEGGVWVALWDGGALRRYLPNGQLDRTMAFPVRNVTKCAFGGASYEDLFVTTASQGLTPDERRDQPLAGGVFHYRPGVPGKRPHLFTG